MEITKLDQVDIRLLQLLQEDASMSVARMAEIVGMSQSPCNRRVRALLKGPLVRKQTVLLNPAEAGLPITVLVQVSLNRQRSEELSHFEGEIEQIPEVMDCFLITGSQSDYLLRLLVRDLEHYQQILLERLTHLPEINSIISNFVIRQPIQRTSLPLEQVD